MRTLNEEIIIPFLNFKSHNSAWNEVAVEFQHDKLRIRYAGREESLSLHNVEDFEELKSKFRYPSIQLEDKHCRKALPGTNVCAFHSDADRRYFDARIENVSWSRHIIVNREEQCMCTYEVLWLAGPYEGKKTIIHCENICLIQYKSIQSHPIIKDVLNYLKSKRTCKSQFAAEISLQEKIVHFRHNVHKPFKSLADDFLAEKGQKSPNGGVKYWIDVEDELGDINLKPAAGNEGERIPHLENEPNEARELYMRSKVELTRKRCYDGIGECDAKKFRYGNSSEPCEHLPGSHVIKADYVIGFESSASAWTETKRLEDRSKLDLKHCSDEIIEFDANNVGYDNSSEHCEPQSQFTKVDHIVDFEPSAPPWKGMGKVEKSVDHKLNVKDSIFPSEENFHLHGIVDVANKAHADGLAFPKQENLDTVAATCNLESFDSEKGTLTCIDHVKDENLLKRPSECSGGLLDHVSPWIGEECSRNILAKSNNIFDCHPGYFSVGGHVNCVNEWKGFPEDCLRKLGDSNKIVSPMKINDAKQDVRSTKNVSWEKEKIWDAAQNQATTNACNIYSHRRCREPRVTNYKIHHRDNFIQKCGPRRNEEQKDQQMLFPSAHVLVLENLDKYVTPADVLSLICQAGGDSAKVYIMPTQFFEKFTRGFVFFQDEERLQRVSAFLRNENILIASSDGRPWVVMDEGNGLSQSYFADLASGSEYCGHVLSKNINILYKGTPEYKRAEKLRNKFLEWRQHLKLLHKGLAYSENVIVQANIQTSQL